MYHLSLTNYLQDFRGQQQLLKHSNNYVSLRLHLYQRLIKQRTSIKRRSLIYEPFQTKRRTHGQNNGHKYKTESKKNFASDQTFWGWEVLAKNDRAKPKQFIISVWFKLFRVTIALYKKDTKHKNAKKVQQVRPLKYKKGERN